MRAIDVYAKSDGALTRSYYAELERRGALGLVAMNLFRAQKCSSRAKKYRGGIRGGGSFRGMAYNRKGWSIEQLCLALGRCHHFPSQSSAEQVELMRPHIPCACPESSPAGITYGWAADPTQEFNRHVLYVDLPQGQVSFHSPTRYTGPDYPGQWDGQHQSEARILAFCDSVFQREAVAA